MSGDPIARLELLPDWWRGAILVRIQAANEHPPHSEAFRHHMEIAADYQRREMELAK